MDKDQEFKIVDKRRFDDSGQELSNNDVEEKNQPVKGDTPYEQVNVKGSDYSSDQIDFASFLVGVYSQTLIYLGEIPNPESGLVSKHLEAARQNIDILAILQEKTKGNLSKDEDGLMNEILNNVRMIFVKNL